MLKLLPILLSAVVNIANVNIFEIEGIFSSGHINALERYIEEVEQEENNLLIIQYNASDVNENSIIELRLDCLDLPGESRVDDWTAPPAGGPRGVVWKSVCR